MKSMTIRFGDDLMDWLNQQAMLNHRSANKQLEHVLTQLKKESERERYQTGVLFLCANGLHNFRLRRPADSDFCNCKMYMFSEVK